MCILSIINQKGGVGKTTTSLNFASGLSLKDKKVLLIDIDPQSSLTKTLLDEKKHHKSDFYSSFKDGNGLDRLIKKTNLKNVDLIPSSMDLINLERELIIDEEKWDNIFEDQIKNLVEKSNYDFIIIDCPSTINTLLKKMLSISDHVIIPTNLEFFSIDALTNLLPILYKIKKNLNNKLNILGILITMYNEKSTYSKEIEFELNKFFKGKIFNTRIPYNNKIAESPSFNQSIFTYSKRSKGAQAYNYFVEEFLNLKEMEEKYA